MHYNKIDVKDLEDAWPEDLPKPDIDRIGDTVYNIVFSLPDGRKFRIRAAEYRGLEFALPYKATTYRVVWGDLSRGGFLGFNEATEYADKLRAEKDLPYMDVNVEEE